MPWHRGLDPDVFCRCKDFYPCNSFSTCPFLRQVKRPPAQILLLGKNIISGGISSCLERDSMAEVLEPTIWVSLNRQNEICLEDTASVSRILLPCTHIIVGEGQVQTLFLLLSLKPITHRHHGYTSCIYTASVPLIGISIPNHRDRASVYTAYRTKVSFLL